MTTTTTTAGTAAAAAATMRQFTLSIAPRVSGTVGGKGSEIRNQLTFGYQYHDADNEETGEDELQVTLLECLQEDQSTSFRRACGEVVISYVTKEANSTIIFETITGLGNEYEDEDEEDDDDDGGDDGDDENRPTPTPPKKATLCGPVTVDRDTGVVKFPF